MSEVIQPYHEDAALPSSLAAELSILSIYLSTCLPALTSIESTLKCRLVHIFYRFTDIRKMSLVSIKIKLILSTTY